MRSRPTSTGFARCSTSAARKRSTGASATTTLLYPLLDMATTLDPHFNIAYRFGAIFLAEPKPGGPGRPDLADRAAAEGPRASARRSGSTCRTSASSTTGRMHDYKAAAEWFERGSEVPGARLVPEAAGGDDPGAGRPARSVAHAVPGARRVGRERLDAQGRASGACGSSTRWTRSTSCASRRAPTATAAAPRRSRGRRWCGRLPARHPADPDGSSFTLGPWSGDVSLGEGSPLAPLPDERRSRRRRCRRHDAAAVRRRRRWGSFGLAIGSFLNVCIFRHPARRVDRATRRRGACRAAGRCAWYHNVPVLSWLVLGGRCAFCAAPISARYPAIELLTGVVFALHGFVFEPDALLAFG